MMLDERQERTVQGMLRVVIRLLESEGYDGVRLREVARRARVSLATIYKFFPTRNHLIVAALTRWMDDNTYSSMAAPPPHTSLYDRLVWVHRRIFEPWERNPRMLEAYHRANAGPGGGQLDIQGHAVVEPAVLGLLEDADPAYAKDIVLIMSNMVWGVIQRFAVGDLPLTDIQPLLERTVYRLTSNNEGLAETGALRGHGARDQRKD